MRAIHGLKADASVAEAIHLVAQAFRAAAIEEAEADGALVFHAGTKLSNGDLVANGGRVLNVVALGRSVGEAQARAYEAGDKIGWAGGLCRRGIGWPAGKREQGR